MFKSLNEIEMHAKNERGRYEDLFSSFSVNRWTQNGVYILIT